MVHIGEADRIPVEQFPRAWRLTDERWSRQPAAVLSRITFLSKARAEELHQLSTSFRSLIWRLDHSTWHAVNHLALNYETDQDIRRMGEWMRSLPVGDSTEVYVVWVPGCALATDWGTVTEIWDDLFYPFDVMDVFDDTLSFAVLYGQ